MEFLEVPLYDDDVFKLGVRFLFNVFFLALLVRFAIHPNQSERAFAFTAVMMNVTVFFICFSLKKLELGLGMALGLFAIFGVLRYRTDAIRTKEMTYLFIVIGLAVINALSNRKSSYIELIVINSAILGVAMLKEVMIGNMDDEKNGSKEPAKKLKEPKKQRKYSIEYDKLEWLGPDHEESLMTDLRERLGIEVQRVQVQNIDMRNQTASLTVWCANGYGDESQAAKGVGDGTSDSS